MRIESTMIPAAISGSKVKVLCALAEAKEAGGNPTMTGLARIADVSTAAMTGVVDALALDGLAERLPCEGDRRLRQVRLTLKGVGLVDSMRAPALGREAL